MSQKTPTEQNPHMREALEGLDQSKREMLSRLIGGGAFVAPVVASFAMQALAIRPAQAQPGSSGPQPPPPPPTNMTE